MKWLKWYLSIPLKALAELIFWIARVRANVRGEFAKIDLKSVITVLTMITAAAWLVIWFMADDSDRGRLTDTVKSYIAGEELPDPTSLQPHKTENGGDAAQQATPEEPPVEPSEIPAPQ